MSKRKRRKHTPEQKVAVLKRHLLEQTPISDLCDEYDLHPTVFNRWLKAFFENGPRAFEPSKNSSTARLEKKISELESKITKKNEVLGELMEEHVALKKSLGEI